VTEQGLFYAYRNLEGYATECACGDEITSVSGSEATVGEAVRLHNESTVHQQWSEWQEAVHALQRPARKPCPCHAHGAA
jgi:hypothetical protein